MKKLTLLLSLSFIFLFSFQTALKKFPEMQGEKLDDSVISLPNDLAGKYSLLVLAYSQKAESDLKTWESPLFNKFIAKPKANDPFAFSTYDINLMFVPMFTGVNQAAEGQAKKKMKAEINATMQPYFMVFKGNAKDLKETLGMTEKDAPYIYLLDKNGNIVYHTSGAYSQAKLGAIEDKIEE